MKANKVLFITQEITPYVPESEMANMGRFLPQAIQEKGREIRTFMPKWGNVNERRNQLHEVIRLSREEQVAFVNALLTPTEPGARLKQSVLKYRQKAGL